jgi:small basic protein
MSSDLWVAYFAFNVPLALIIGFIGKKLGVGFWHPFLWSVLLSGVLGFYLMIFVARDKD